MFDKETLKIVEIVRDTPDSKVENDITMKRYTDLVTEASNHGVSQSALEFGLSRLPKQGLAVVYRSQSGKILGISTTKMFRDLFT